MEICKFSRVGNGGRNSDSVKIISDEDEAELKNNGGGDNNNNNSNAVVNRLCVWQPTTTASRIIRVSRASGGKDRHSKVWTSKGLRDRRVRLSVTTAIQFYDLQDRLGYDQPSKAVEWLIKAASESIAELPSLSGSFPETPKQLSDENRGSDHEHEQLALIDSADVEMDGAGAGDENEFGGNRNRNQNHLSLSKSACSSTSETSKGSGLSLSRPDVRVNRVKARERARERAAKEKESDCHNPISSSSFTELLTNGGANNQNPRQWSPAMDYFSSGGLFRGPAGFQLGINSMFNENHQELHPPPPPHQHFPFVLDHHLSGGGGGASDYNLNFNLAGNFMNRGTLQSNLSTSSISSPSAVLPFQRYAAATNLDGSNLPFFIGTPSSDNGLDGSRLQLYYGDGTSRHSDHKGKGKH